MSSPHSPAASDYDSETVPAYTSTLQDNYIEGYDPVSLSAPHSSLLNSSTWVGMGTLIGGALWGVGIFILGLSLQATGRGTIAQYSDIFLVIGPIIAVILGVAGFGLIRYGRRNYRQYKKETGRSN